MFTSILFGKDESILMNVIQTGDWNQLENLHKVQKSNLYS